MNARLPSLLLVIFMVPCSGQEVTPAGESYASLLPHLKRHTLVVPEGESFTSMFARIKIATDKHDEPASGPITALSLNPAGTCLAVGFKNSLMVVLDRDKHTLTSFTLPGMVHSLLLDPSCAFITVACDDKLYNVGYKERLLKRRLLPAEYEDFFGMKDDEVESYTLKVIPADTPTYAFESVGKYLVFNRAKGTLILNLTPSSYREWFHSYKSDGGGILVRFDNAHQTEVTSLSKGYLIAGHDDSPMYITAHKNKVTIQGKGAEMIRPISFPSMVSSLKAIRAQKDQYLIGTAEGKAYHYTVGAGLPKLIVMEDKTDRRPFSVLTANDNGTIAVGSVGNKLYCGYKLYYGSTSQ